ncbi:hypothetical protein CHARACLAT_021032 [Characodon lateralis]|uniref:Uncharacterized protein n=1 Tax=Characodon lateralis TaxID=208331 RepID=A0ABU7DKK0_9TELE|nr:hypothetical protein [Characodon lateralis]
MRSEPKRSKGPPRAQEPRKDLWRGVDCSGSAGGLPGVIGAAVYTGADPAMDPEIREPPAEALTSQGAQAPAKQPTGLSRHTPKHPIRQRTATPTTSRECRGEEMSVI